MPSANTRKSASVGADVQVGPLLAAGADVGLAAGDTA